MADPIADVIGDYRAFAAQQRLRRLHDHVCRWVIAGQRVTGLRRLEFARTRPSMLTTPSAGSSGAVEQSPDTRASSELSDDEEAHGV